MTLYEELKAAGCALSHHESDLYVPLDEVSRPILLRHRKRFDVFVDQVIGRLSADIFGAYDPFWGHV